jgi:CheY-like chemotaxis protein
MNPEDIHLRQAPTVLVVDDDEDTRVTIADLLRDHGYHVVSVSNGRAAAAYLRQNPPPSCLVLDLWMPEMNGWTFASEMMSGRLPSIPTVVVTAAEPHWGYPAQPPLVVRKPLVSEKLLAAVRSVAPF